MVNKEKLLRDIFNEHYQHLYFYAGKYIKDQDDALSSTGIYLLIKQGCPIYFRTTPCLLLNDTLFHSGIEILF